MKVFRYLIISCIFFLLAGNALSQTQGRPVVDSLVFLLANSKEDTIKVRLLERLSAAYYPISPDTGIFYGNLALTLSEKLKWGNLLGWANNSIGVNYWAKSDYLSAMEYYLKALKLAEQKNDSSLITAVLGNISTIYFDQGEYDKALEADLKIIEMYEALGDQIAVARNMGNVAQTYTQMKQFPLAIDYYNQAYAINKVLDRKLSMAINLEGLANIYASQNNEIRALEYNYRALQLNKDVLNKRGLASVYRNIGSDYLNLAATNNDASLVNQIHLNRKQALQRAQSYIDSSAMLNKEMGNLSALSGNYEKLSKIKELSEDYKGALATLKESILLSDSVFSLGKNKELTEKLMQYEFDKKQAVAQVEQERKDAKAKQIKIIQFSSTGVILIVTGFLYLGYRQQQKGKSKIEKAYTELKATQAQLIQSEKMASLGELTAGISHEIQNPLNFVNNFSEVSTELVDDMTEELIRGNHQSAMEIANDLKQNLDKINYHGKRAGDIVKGMLQHSRSSSGQKELTDINALCDEYLRLSYHGLRAKDKSFNAKFVTDFDASLPKINVVPQDIGRMILNLINNAFYAVNERLRQAQPDSNYEPIVSVSTHISLSAGEGRGEVLIKVKDNGKGIPEAIKEKIFQPFFTTKPTGQGTGLGLSLSYDIVKAHGGTLSIKSKEGEGAEFIVQLSIT